MIKTVRVEYFKRFRDETFSLDDAVVLAGPNNAGKSTLLQAISVWRSALQRWLAERSTGSSKAKLRTGVPVSRKDFTAIPLRDMNLLWFERDTAYKRGEKTKETKAGEPKLIAITLSGADDSGVAWTVTVTLRHTSKEQVYVRLLDETGTPLTSVPAAVQSLNVVHIPACSGIGSDEPKYDHGYQDLLIGQGKPGDILRNLLLDVYSNNCQDWDLLRNDVLTMFGYEILEPKYAPGDPYIVIEYRHSNASTHKAFDLASAGSGFHQVLTLLGFFYSRPASILLMDEPDAHQHVFLQRRVYDRLRIVARNRKCQLIVATHSEVILDDTAPTDILSFYGRPHRLNVQMERKEVQNALRLLSSLDILDAESGKNVLYGEGETDMKILREFAQRLGHRMTNFFTRPFFVPINGHKIQEARQHLHALKAIKADIKGVLLVDGDNRNLPDHEIGADGLTIIRWIRYEIENYLLHPEALLRFVQTCASTHENPAQAAQDFMHAQLPPAVLSNPLEHHAFLNSIRASKDFLPQLFKASGTAISKNEYYEIAAQMNPAEVPQEVIDKLDVIAAALGI